jgi:hypothetical protein
MGEEFKKGDLVRWFESYADDSAVKDTGIGVIIRKLSYPMRFSRKTYENFEVFRTHRADTMLFDRRELRKIEKGE